MRTIDLALLCAKIEKLGFKTEAIQLAEALADTEEFNIEEMTQKLKDGLQKELATAPKYKKGPFRRSTKKKDTAVQPEQTQSLQKTKSIADLDFMKSTMPKIHDS